MNPIIIALITVAIGSFALVEVLIAYQKYQLKRQYIKELDEFEALKNRKSETDIKDSGTDSYD